MDQQQLRWWTIGRRILWAVIIVIALVSLFLLIRIGYAHHWTGFGQSHVTNANVQPGKTLWDWLELLIVPVVLAVGGYLFTRSERQATQEAAQRRAQDDILQAYLDGMSQLLIDRVPPLHTAQPGENLSTVARARTLTVLAMLDGGRKRSVLEFLYESRLIDRERTHLVASGLIERRYNVVKLDQAQLEGTDLSRVHLAVADLSGANLRNAQLSNSDLQKANLTNANLHVAILYGANLHEANLQGADLSNAYLDGADLSNAYLGGAPIARNAELLEQQAESLKGATMPNGQKYEDRLKDREKRQQAE